MSVDERDLLATYLAGTGIIADEAACTDDDPLTPCTYLEDAFSVAGSQGVQSADDLAEDGYVVEWGPNGFLDNEPATLDLVRAIGLESELRRSAESLEATPVTTEKDLARLGGHSPFGDGPRLLVMR